MKKFRVSNDCMACGQCIQMTDLLVENAVGKIEVAQGYITENFIDQAKQIVSECPARAISIIEVGNTKASGKEGLKELKGKLEEKLYAFQIPRVNLQDVQFKAINYMIDIPYARGEYIYSYSNHSQAKNAGKDEFNQIMYSQYRPIMLSVFVQYKNDKLQSFYTCERTDKSFYFRSNRRIEGILQEFADEAHAITDGAIKLPNEFTKFDIYPNNQKESYMSIALAGFENRSTQSGIMAAFNNLSGTSLSSYADYLDTVSVEEYVGESFFGNSKYQTKWCYKGIRSACEEYVKDLRWAMDYVDIDEVALEVVQNVINAYTENVKKAFEGKMNMFVQSINNL